MIVCSCNVLSDQAVRSAVAAAPQRPRSAGQVYGCLGCSAQCGRCARTIKRIMDEALSACPAACACCPRQHAAAAGEAAASGAPAHQHMLHQHPVDGAV